MRTSSPPLFSATYGTPPAPTTSTNSDVSTEPPASDLRRGASAPATRSVGPSTTKTAIRKMVTLLTAAPQGSGVPVPFPDTYLTRRATALENKPTSAKIDKGLERRLYDQAIAENEKLDPKERKDNAQLYSGIIDAAIVYGASSSPYDFLRVRAKRNGGVFLPPVHAALGMVKFHAKRAAQAAIPERQGPQRTSEKDPAYQQLNGYLLNEQVAVRAKLRGAATQSGMDDDGDTFTPIGNNGDVGRGERDGGGTSNGQEYSKKGPTKISDLPDSKRRRLESFMESLPDAVPAATGKDAGPLSKARNSLELERLRRSGA